jgi:hypothetical protein
MKVRVDGEARDDVQPQYVGIGVFRVPFDPVVAHEDGLVFPDRAGRAHNRVQLTHCSADEFGGMLLRSPSGLESSFLGAVGAC